MHYLKLCYRSPRSEALPCEEESLICASDDATNESFENSGNELVW